MRHCSQQGTTATNLLTRFIKLYLDDKLDRLDFEVLDERFDQRVQASLEQHLEQHLSSYLNKYLADHLADGKELRDQVIALSEKIAFFEGQLTAAKPRTSSKSTKPQPEREFWLTPDRARHLGVKLNANHRLKIEMFASDAYKERHGQLPQRRLYRNTQAFAFPAADVDILDATIRGVLQVG